MEYSRVAREEDSLGVNAAHRRRLHRAAGMLLESRKGLARELQRLDRAGSGTAPQSGVRTAILRFLITSMPRPDLEALIGLSGAESDGALDYVMFLDHVARRTADHELAAHGDDASDSDTGSSTPGTPERFL